MSKILIYASSDPYSSAELSQEDLFETYDAIIALEANVDRYEQKDYFKFINYGDLHEIILPEGVATVSKTNFIAQKNCNILICNEIHEGDIKEDGGIDFDLEKIHFLSNNTALFIFTNAYNRLFHYPLPTGQELISLPPLKECYGIIDTKDWSFEFVKR